MSKRGSYIMKNYKTKNKTGYYRTLSTHIEMYSKDGEFLGNATDWKALERFGKQHGYYFTKAVV